MDFGKYNKFDRERTPSVAFGDSSLREGAWGRLSAIPPSQDKDFLHNFFKRKKSSIMPMKLFGIKRRTSGA